MDWRGQPSNFSSDSIDTYLKEPLISTSKVNNAGGVLQYWEKVATTHLHLAQMALDFLTAPGELCLILPVMNLFTHFVVSVVCQC